MFVCMSVYMYHVWVRACVHVRFNGCVYIHCMNISRLLFSNFNILVFNKKFPNHKDWINDKTVISLVLIIIFM